MLVGLTLRVEATSIVAPRHLGELARQSDAVVLARALGSGCHSRGSLLFTDTEFDVEVAVAGAPWIGDTISVHCPGGEIDGMAWLVSGAPEFRPGEAYLLFLLEREDGRWMPAMLSYGVLRESAGAGGVSVLVPLASGGDMLVMPRPDGEAVEPVMPCVTGDLLAHLSEVARGAAAWDASRVHADPSMLVDEATDLGGGGAAVPAGCAFFEDSGRNFRWRTFDSAGTATILADSMGDPSIAGGGLALVNDALEKWHGITGTSLNLELAPRNGATPSCSGGQDALPNTILFSDPCSDIGDLQGCAGVLGFGGPLVPGSTHRFDGATWLTINGWIAVLNNGIGCLGDENYRRLVAHEVGHGLGFNHVEDSRALMFANCCNNPNATDVRCTRYAYPSIDADNERPVVSAGPDRRLLLAGTTARLVGTASDDGAPGGPLVTTWRQIGGPAPVRFEDSTELETTVTFPVSGTYTLVLSAFDGELLRSDAVELDVSVDAGNRRLLVFQQRVGGYTGTVDTFLQESEPATTNPRAAEINVDGDDPSGSGLAAQSLLRFEEIFGDEDGQIPPGAAITSAWLELETTNPGDGAAIYRMEEEWDERSSWNVFGGDGVQAGREAIIPLEAVVLGVDGTVRVDVTSSLEAWSAEPCANFGWVFLPRGDDGWDFYSAEGAEPPRLLVEFAITPEETLVEIGDSWQYFKGRVNPPAGWNTVGFTPDASWLRGPTGIGYGDSDDATVIGDMRGSFLTLYLRRELDIAEPGAIGGLRLRVDYDDGFIAYLNGQEVARSASLGAPGSPVGRTTPASSREAGGFEEFRLPRDLLRAGVNVLAAEVHNADVDSSDLSFIPELIGGFQLIEDGETWRFLRGAAPVPLEWNQPGFDDSAWEEGATGIGYGDGDDLTQLDDMQGAYLAVFLRKTFEVADPSSFEAYRLTVIHDDGVVLYLNGVEIGRANMPAGVAGRTTAASASIEPTATTISIPVDRVVAGVNVLAASVHNAAVDSSDLSFTATLVPAVTPGSLDCDAPPPPPPPPPPPAFRRGDVGGEGDVNLSDAVKLLNFLFIGGDDPACADAADADDDGSLRINDATVILNFLFLGSRPPAAPGVTCGPDPTPDDALGECATGGCAE